MIAKIIENQAFRDKEEVFQDREEAGTYLAKVLEEFRGRAAIILAIPSGGVPVGLAIASYLDLPFDLLIIRKIPIPGNPEAGFGALNLEGDMILNEPMVRRLGLTPEEIEQLAQPVKEELQQRNRLFRENRPWPELKGRIVILVDDGLASGYTMMTAATMVQRHSPALIVAAVPTAPLHTVEMLSRYVDIIICPNIRTEPYFAVASAYRNWYDLNREEVISLLKKHGLIRY